MEPDFCADTARSNGLNTSQHNGDAPCLACASAMSELAVYVALINQLLPQIAAQCPQCGKAIQNGLETASHMIESSPAFDCSKTHPVTQVFRWKGLAPIIPEHFTRREQDVLHLLVLGLSNRKIAERLVITPSTAKWYVQQIYSKLHVHNRDDAMRRAQELFSVVRSAQ